ncbi:uncharacterized protein LOC115034437 [Acyrthosiphon pisum]|uniref:THAP domain-containing protein 9 n=1 Tax=Acyrthosiphon pisum TaxID=7029 RepID=A0A8R2JUP8_ACYPI|nr:uncharacterized protein LOC115034437 [Acyrthosiphon pisum]
MKKKTIRAKQGIKRLKNILSEVQNQMKNCSDTIIQQSLESAGINTNQCNLIKEIFAAAKVKNPKGRRYSEDWMMLCLLFQIRSPSGYKFLKDQNILPFPCVNTIRKHLLAMKIGCGFDINFFKLFKKKFSGKTEYQKKGIIVLDEIFLRTSIAVNSRTLTYSGLEDFGDDEDIKTKSTDKADHGLVLMWQSLAENFTQPIAVFASKGPVKGIDLAKLVIKAILLLEDAGGHVVGLTSDGASTNRSMWKELGICPDIEGFKNFFENPYDNDRKVFVFSDVPHLMKTIRNRLHSNKQLRINSSKQYIKWSDYYSLYLNESTSLLKVCPKLTKHHFELNNFTKMKVKYATQVGIVSYW